MSSIDHSLKVYSKALGDFVSLKGYDLYPFDENGNFPMDENGKAIPFTGKVFVCPLCCKNLYHHDYKKKSLKDYVTFDHVPPKSVGSMYKVPVCNKCNSTLGTTIDSHLKKEIAMHAFLSGHPTSKTKAELKVNANRYIRGLELITQTNHIQIKLPPINGRFNAKEIITNELFVKNKIDLIFSTSNSNKAILSLTKAAYLMMFRLFGYEFIFNENASKLRDIIFEQRDNPISSRGLISFDAPEHFVGVSIISSPKNLASYLCTIPLKDLESNFLKNYAIIMPGPGVLGWNYYENFAKLELGHQLNTTVTVLESKPLYSESIFDGYTSAWQHYCK